MIRLATALTAAALLPIAALLPAARAQAQEPNDIRRFALIVGANDGGPERVSLRYAARDAQAFDRVLEQLGGMAPEDRLLILDPKRAQLMGGLDQLHVMLATADAQAGGSGRHRNELLIYYSGHSDNEGLLLGGERVSYTELRRAIDAVPADVRITILDSCESGTLTRLKGGRMQQPFLVDASTEVRGRATLTSSSADEAAQESDDVGGSFFTHFLVSGLRGAADTTGDKKVTLNEAYQFAFHETLARTEGTRSGAQHPSYDFQLAGSGDVVLTDLRTTSAGLRLPATLHGRIFVRDASGQLVAELRKTDGRETLLGLPPGAYTVLVDQEGHLSRAELTLTDGQSTPLEPGTLVAFEGDANTLRGGAAPPAAPASAAVTYREQKVNLALVPGESTNDAVDGPERNTLSIALLGARAGQIHGLALGGLFHWVDDSVEGVSANGLGSYIGGNLSGADWAGLASVVRGDVGGAQAGGLVNVAQGEVTGIQMSGGVNYAGKNVGGIQASGVLSIAKGDVIGLQLSPVNQAQRVTGLQLGLVNVAQHVDGVPFGLVSWVQDGLHVPELYATGYAPLNVDLKLGNEYVFTGFSVGYSPIDKQRVFGGFTLGGRIPFGHFHLDVEAASHTIVEDNFKTLGGQLATLDTTLGWRPFDGYQDFAIFGGPALNVHVAQDKHEAQTGRSLAFGPTKAWTSGDTTVRLSPGLKVGLGF